MGSIVKIIIIAIILVAIYVWYNSEYSPENKRKKVLNDVVSNGLVATEKMIWHNRQRAKISAIINAMPKVIQYRNGEGMLQAMLGKLTGYENTIDWKAIVLERKEKGTSYIDTYNIF